jgi:hypothetical protein
MIMSQFHKVPVPAIPTLESSLEELDRAFLEAAIEVQVAALRLAVAYWALGKISNRIKDKIANLNQGRRRKDKIHWLPHLEKLAEQSGLGTTTLRKAMALARRLDREDVEGLTFVEAQRLAGILCSEKEQFEEDEGVSPKGKDAPKGKEEDKPTDKQGTQEESGEEGEARKPTGDSPKPTDEVITTAQPREEPVLPQGEPIPPDVSSDEAEAAIAEGLTKCAAVIEGLATAVERVRPRKLPVERIRRAIAELQRILMLAEA